MDRRLNIAITKSRIESYTVEVAEDGAVNFSCNLALLTEHGKKVTTVCHSTQHWNSKVLKVPAEAFPIAGELSKLLHDATEQHIVNMQNLLEAPCSK